MANVHLHVGSFNAGELSPLMGARFAVEKVQSGCRKLRNFMVHVHGPAFRRPGMEYIGPAASNEAASCLRGFNFSTTTGFILEFHAFGLKVFSNGVAVPLLASVVTPYSATECFELQMAQVNDVCYIVHPAHEPRKLVRYGDTDWRIEYIEWKWPALGDENVADAGSLSRGLVEYPTCEWPEFSVPAGARTVSITDPPLGAGTKIVKFWFWSGGVWVEGTTARLTWTTTAPAAISLPSTGPGPAAVWRITLAGDFETINPFPYTGQNPVVKMQWATGKFELRLNDGWPVSHRTFTSRTGTIQPYIGVLDNVNGGATMGVDKWIAGAWVQQEILTALATGVVVQGTVAATTAGDLFRLRWIGRQCTLSGQPGVCGFQNLNAETTSGITLMLNATSGQGVTMTASVPLFEAGHLGSYWALTHRREASVIELIAAVPTISAATSSELEVSGKWDFFTYGTWDATVTLQRKVGTGWENYRSWSSNSDRNVIASGDEENGTVLRLKISAGTSASATGAAVPRFILEASDSRVTGLVRVTALGALVDGLTTTATVDVLKAAFATTATTSWAEGAWSEERGYPRAVALHGERLWFGGTASESTRLWGSVIADYENFQTGSVDDDAVSFVPAAQQSNRIQWLLSQNDNLIFGTNGDEWTLAGGTEGGPITPTSVNVQRRSGYGSQYLPALILGDVAVFVQRGGRKLRSAQERQDALTWSATDLTVLAEHVSGTGCGIKQLAVQLFPQTILWAVTAEGTLIGMTFEQDQNVFAWHVHTTDGLIESVAVVNNAETDEVWLSVNRNGVRTVERFSLRAMSREFDEPERLIYVDNAVLVENSPASATITGLHFPDGTVVAVMGDGAEMALATVANAEITLVRAVNVAVVGLPFTSELQPMRLDIPMEDGTAQGRRWKTARVALYVHASLGGQIADSPDSRFESFSYRQVDHPMDSPPPLFTGEIETTIEATVRDNVDATVKTSGVHPLNIASMVIKGDVYGE